MRNLFVIGAVALGLFATSCEKNANVVGTGTVKLTPMMEKTSGLGKNVDRGDIPVYIKEINVVATNGSKVNDFNFELTEGNVDGSEFIMDGLPLGLTSFKATTTPAIISKYAKTKFTFGVKLKDELVKVVESDRFVTWVKKYHDVDVESLNLNDKLVAKNLASYLKDRMLFSDSKGNLTPWSISKTGFIPYAVYTGGINAVVLNATEEIAPTEVKFNLTTNNGRKMITFRPETIKSLENVWVRVTIKAGENTYTNVMNSNALIGSFYWSDENAIDGENIDITLEWLDAGSIGAKDKIANAIGTHNENKWTKHFFGTRANLTVLKTQKIEGISIKKGLSTWVDIVLNASSFTAKDQTAMFTVEEIKDTQEHIIIE